MREELGKEARLRAAAANTARQRETDLENQIEALREKDRALKRERERIENAIKAGRPRLYALVEIKKAVLAGQDISEPEGSTSV